jgi:serine/threonine protein kinase
MHRDLAPSNILLDPDFKLKLADFGLAKKYGT